VNARDAMPDGGVLMLGTEVGEGGEGEPSGRVARLLVSDTGVGMTEQVKAQIFEPFFTTKGPDKGTGLGLATVFGIVEQAGGRIRVASSPGAGTKFRIAFPWCQGLICSARWAESCRGPRATAMCPSIVSLKLSPA
jgi:two-component system cell cycle sensor histidine kinase/response regulator CckA